MSKTIKQWVTACHKNAVQHGFYSNPVSIVAEIEMCKGELNEALTALEFTGAEMYLAKDAPEGWGVELADCVMRIMSLCGQTGVDLEGIMEAKYAYNRTRPYKHGKE